MNLNPLKTLRSKLEDRRVEKRAQHLLETQEHVPPGSVADVYLHPERYSRAARRIVGYRRPTGLLTEQHLGLVVHDDPVAQVPRYVRRHLNHLVTAKTRRQRKARARMIRILTAHDMMKGSHA